MNNKWTRAAIPALLLHFSIGTVYCWSLFSEAIGTKIGWSKPAVEWAFSFAIFFLGMSAAFLGTLVEKNIHLSSLVATICFTVGMAGTGFFIWYGGAHKHSLVSLIGLYVCYGFIMGVGLGTGYLSPVKTLMLWFEDKKGLATGLAVAGFGGAKAIASPIMEWLAPKFGVDKMFYILAVVYFIMMFVGHLLLKKPDGWVEPKTKDKSEGVLATIKSKGWANYIGIWVMFYINITCGLALISQEKMIVKCIGLAAFAGVISTFAAIFNAGGRLGFSAWADTLKDRNTVYKLIFIISIALTGLTIITGGIKNAATYSVGCTSIDIKSVILVVLVVALILMVNAAYGGGFSNVPTLLHDHYGMGNISAIHGITLSAWAFAGLTGNQMATFIVEKFGKPIQTGINIAEKGKPAEYLTINPTGYQYVLYATIVLYVVALLMSVFLVKKSDKAIAAKKAKAAN